MRKDNWYIPAAFGDAVFETTMVLPNEKFINVEK